MTKTEGKAKLQDYENHYLVHSHNYDNYNIDLEKRYNYIAV